MPPKDEDLTPMYRQWAQAKRDFPDVLLLFRMGDFYEMFGEDAEIGAREMGLTLTARKYSGDKRMPMCGVPYHALDRHLRLLVEKGFRAAICEQIEDPKLAKGLVQRQVTRVVTPGTLTEDELLPATDNNFLVSVYTEGQATGLAAVDVSTGDFLVTEVSVLEGPHAQSHRASGPPPEGAGGSANEAGSACGPSSRSPGALPLDPQSDPLAVAVADEINRLRPAEIIVRGDDPAAGALDRVSGATITRIGDTDPVYISAAEQLCTHFGVDSLRGFGCQDMPAAIGAAAQALRYLQATHLNALPRLSGLTTYSTGQFMVIDATTRRNLELTESLRGGKQGTLVALLDKTRTPMGARLLRAWLVQPLLDKRQIDRRLQAVENLVQDTILADTLGGHLRRIYDLERLTSRVTAGTANGRDLKALGASLQRLPDVRRELAGAKTELLAELCGALGEGRSEGPHAQPSRASGPGAAEGAGGSADATGSACGPSNVADTSPPETVGAPREGLAVVADLLARAIADDPPVQLTEGGLIREGYSAELDELRNAAAHGREWIAALQDQERARTGIKNLKIGFNNVFGYYIEVTRSGQNLVPDDYTRKQTLANAERFITPELKEWESKVLGADERSRVMEHELFVQVRSEVAAQADSIIGTARALAQVDVLCALAQSAVEYGYRKPEIVEGDELQITAGRHPVVERSVSSEGRALARPGPGTAEAVPSNWAGGEPFVPNDVHLDCQANQLMIITGPNMAGKSTYLRQVALITLLAQMGSFVPATEARIGLVDRIFTRVGASDDLATGQSTFMVEMTETANILHNATARSLIILDEIGRGTSTFDGLSIAWAVAEHIVRSLGAKTLFATHYHHLNELAEILPRVKNLRILVKEEGDHITFLRKIVAGGTDRSYGIQVARLAGLPAEVIQRAKEVLRTIEQEDLAVAPSLDTARKIAPTVQLQLFESAPSPIIEKLKAVDVDTLTPVEALLLLKSLQEEAGA